jgi:hypothetical protein
MRRAVSALRARAFWQQQQQATPLVDSTVARGMAAMAALDDEAFRRRSFDAAAATPPASSSSVGSASVHTSATASSAAAAAASASAAAAATSSPRFFITGARGQIGVELTRELARTHGAASIVASDLPVAVAAGRALPGGLVEGVRYVSCDVTDREGLSRGKDIGGEREGEGKEVLVFISFG